MDTADGLVEAEVVLIIDVCLESGNCATIKHSFDSKCDSVPRVLNQCD